MAAPPNAYDPARMWTLGARLPLVRCVAVACILATSGCGTDRSEREAELERALAKERDRHNRDSRQLHSDLSASEARYLQHVVEMRTTISRIDLLEEKVRRLERLLRTVPLRHWVDLLSDPAAQEPAMRQVLSAADPGSTGVRALLALAVERADLHDEIVEGLAKAGLRVASVVTEVAAEAGPEASVAQEVARRTR